MAQSRHGSRWWIASAVAVCLLVPGQIVSAQRPFRAVHVAVNRARYTGRCPIDITFTAVLTFTMPQASGFVFNYHWQRSDGAKTQQQVVRVSPKQASMELRQVWHVGSAGKTLDASDTLFVNSGNTHEEQASPVVHVVCK